MPWRTGLGESSYLGCGQWLLIGGDESLFSVDLVMHHLSECRDRGEDLWMGEGVGHGGAVSGRVDEATISEDGQMLGDVGLW